MDTTSLVNMQGCSANREIHASTSIETKQYIKDMPKQLNL